MLHSTVLVDLLGYILLANLVWGLPIHRLEWLGCIIAIIGAIGLMFDPTAEKTDGSKASISGDLLALAGALFGALLYVS